jgi:WhiB family redox-sensing transcriptional regulator
MSNEDYSACIQPTDIADERWKVQAACTGIDTEMFFPEQGHNPDPMLIKMCNACPVRDECIAYALKYSLEGIWGGLGQRGRENYRRRQKITH